MEIVQGEQLFLKPDRLATLKPYYKSEKLPQYTTFKPNNWRFYYIYFVYEREKGEMWKKERVEEQYEIKYKSSFTFIILNYYIHETYLIVRELPTHIHTHTCSNYINYTYRCEIHSGVERKKSDAEKLFLSKYTANKFIESK